MSLVGISKQRNGIFKKNGIQKISFIVVFFIAILLWNSINVTIFGQEVELKSQLSSDKFQLNKFSSNEFFDGKISINDFIIDSTKKISATGLNSTFPAVCYNHYNKRVILSWIDRVFPDTPSALNKIYTVFGNKDSTWSSGVEMATISDSTLKNEYPPNPDNNNSTHFIFEELASPNDFQLVDATIENETTITTNSPISNFATNASKPATTYDLKGNIHLVWIEANNDQGHLFYTIYNGTTENWSGVANQITTSATALATSEPAIIVDENNTVHVIWTDVRTSEHELYYSYFDGLSWSSEEKITTVSSKPINPEIAIDNTNDKLMVLFSDTINTTDLYYIEAATKASSGNWEIPVTISSQYAFSSQYDIYSDFYGNSFMVFQSLVASNNEISYKAKGNSSTVWSSSSLLSTPKTNSFHPAVTADLKGTFYITYASANVGEYQEIYLTFLTLDSDGDGLSDIEEVTLGEDGYKTNPYNSDSDSDGLPDGDEVTIHNTNPNSADSDNDDLPDLYEITNGLNPNDDQDRDDDLDNDQLTNYNEYTNGTNPTNSDTDGDNLEDGEEIIFYNTDPLDIDTDNDDLTDGEEVAFGLDPLVFDDKNADPDDDGLTTEYEITIGTLPLVADTDGDGFSDGEEVDANTDPLDPADYPIQAPVKNYDALIRAIAIIVASIFFVVAILFLILRQFKPKKSSKRKDLEREERILYKEHTEKPDKKTWEMIEQEKIELAAKKRFEDLHKTDLKTEPVIVKEKDIPSDTSGLQRIGKVSKDELPKEEVTEPIPEIKLPRRRGMLDKQKIEEKRQQLQKHIETMKNYRQKLEDLRKTKMKPEKIAETSREQLTEYAAESQSIYAEAKTLWNTTILSLIKGAEDELHVETLKAEKILDNCSELSNEILDLLIKRELEFTEDVDKKEDIKQKAKRAIQKAKEEEKEMEEFEQTILDEAKKETKENID